MAADSASHTMNCPPAAALSTRLPHSNVVHAVTWSVWPTKVRSSRTPSPFSAPHGRIGVLLQCRMGCYYDDID
eukprot:6085247-Pyramimonas_sp.AAC.1